MFLWEQTTVCIIDMQLLFIKVERFFERIKKMNVVRFFLLTWLIHISWTIVVGLILFLSGIEFSQHVASDSEFTNSFLMVPITALAEEALFRWGPMVALVFSLTYCYRSKRLTKNQFFEVEKYCLLAVVFFSSIIFGWAHGNIFNVLIQGVSGVIFYVIYLRCYFIERDRGVRDRMQIVPFAESTIYHAVANSFLLFM